MVIKEATNGHGKRGCGGQWAEGGGENNRGRRRARDKGHGGHFRDYLGIIRPYRGCHGGRLGI